MFVSAILVAGGLGLRMRSVTPKQFLKIGSKEILSYSLEKMASIDVIDEIILVLPEKDYSQRKNELKQLAEKLNIGKITKGGEKRQDSVYKGFNICEKSSDVIVIHDAVRPFFNPKTVVDGIKLLDDCDGVVCAVAVNDTVKKVDGENVINETIDRKGLFRSQTPQIFKSSILRKAFDKAAKNGKNYTDESAMAEAIDAKIKIIEGSEDNIKITKAEDMKLAEYLLSNT